MCGIYGYFKLTEKDTLSDKDYKTIIRWLSLNNMSRGKDSTGLATIDKDYNVDIMKKTKHAKQFIKNKNVRYWLDMNISKQTKGVLGHTRFATQGEVNVVNAQPFKYDHIVGTHNGHINNYKQVFIENNLQPYTTCDSESIFAGLSMQDNNTKKANFLSSLYGYLAIAFVNQRIKGSIFFARKDGQLSLYKTVNNSVIFWSSEKHVMQNLSAMFTSGLERIKLNNNELIEVNKAGIIRTKIKEDIIINNWQSSKIDKNTYSNHYPGQTCDWCFQSKQWIDYTREYDCFLCDDCKRFFGLDYTY